MISNYYEEQACIDLHDTTAMCRDVKSYVKPVLGEKIKYEDGVGKVVNFIMKLLENQIR